MTKRAAVLDLGTNTFQLLIAERLGGKLNILHRDERWVNLAEESIERIGNNALQRIAETLADYKSAIDSFKVDQIVATGTAAFREALNREDAIDLVEKLIGVKPEVIAGEEEAKLIYEGVRLATQDFGETVLVMDIGGGSTEFIIGRGDDILWKKSYPLGATLLRQMFHKSDPIAKDEIEKLREHVITSTKDLQEVVSLHQPLALIGASGSFDSFASIMFYPNKSQDVLIELDKIKLNELLNNLVEMNEAERRLVQGLVSFRVGPIVTASVLTQTVIDTFSIQRVYQSAYALKEGMMNRVLLDQ